MSTDPPLLLSRYEVNTAYDEMLSPTLEPRPVYETLFQRLHTLSAHELAQRQRAADQAFLHRGITFTVYGHDEGTEKIFPYDVLPRILSRDEWRKVDEGLTQRITALNLFLKDLYGEGKILVDQVVPRRLVYSCKHYRREMQGVRVPHDIYVSFVVLLAPALARGQAAFTSGNVVDPDRLARIDSVLERYVREDRVAGAVGVVLRDGEVIYERAVGWADREASRRMTPDAVFRIASQSKAIAFLRERLTGPLGMNDTGFFLPPEHRDRLASVYTRNSEGRVRRAEDGPHGQGDYVDGPRRSFSGGAGLLSTARDYARFLEMIRNGGGMTAKPFSTDRPYVHTSTRPYPNRTSDLVSLPDRT